MTLTSLTRTFAPWLRERLLPAQCAPEKLQNSVQLTQHLIDEHDVHPGIEQPKSSIRFIVKKGMSDLLTRKR